MEESVGFRLQSNKGFGCGLQLLKQRLVGLINAEGPHGPVEFIPLTRGLESMREGFVVELVPLLKGREKAVHGSASNDQG